MGLIEKHKIQDAEFHPAIIRDSWQVSMINYQEGFHVDKLRQLTIHKQSDRAIALLNGQAVLIYQLIKGEQTEVAYIHLRPKIAYNIPKQTPYAIIMEEGCQLFCVEGPFNHDQDLIEHQLDPKQLKSIQDRINLEFKK